MTIRCPWRCQYPPLTGDRTHCPHCHHTFTTGALHDRHRRDGACHDPAAAGLLRINGLWTELLLTEGTAL